MGHVPYHFMTCPKKVNMRFIKFYNLYDFGTKFDCNVRFGVVVTPGKGRVVIIDRYWRETSHRRIPLGRGCYNEDPQFMSGLIERERQFEAFSFTRVFGRNVKISYLR